MIDKPAGWTSHDVVGWVRKWAGERKVGHAGTLDPAATGVLPVALNDGTRVLEFLSDASKAYRAEITFGVETDSADGDGTVTAVRAVAFSDGDLNTHSMVSGVRSRSGRLPIRRSRSAASAHTISRGQGLKSRSRATRDDICTRHRRTEQGHVTLDIDCSKGTYIRAIARDLGTALGCGAYLSILVRTRSGPYDLCDAWTSRPSSNRFRRARAMACNRGAPRFGARRMAGDLTG